MVILFQCGMGFTKKKTLEYWSIQYDVTNCSALLTKLLDL